MRKILTLVAFLALAALPADAQFGNGFVAGISAAGPSFTIDGNVTGNVAVGSGSITSVTVSPSLTTTGTTDEIIAVVAIFSQNTNSHVTSIGSCGGLTFTLRKALTGTITPFSTTWHTDLEEWAAPASAALTTQACVANLANVTFCANSCGATLFVFGIKGTTKTFDVNASLPATGQNVTNVTTTPTVTGISTTNASNMLLSEMLDFNQNATQTAGTGYTIVNAVINAAFDMTSAVEFKNVSATQSSVSATFGTNTQDWSMISDAIH